MMQLISDRRVVMLPDYIDSSLITLTERDKPATPRNGTDRASPCTTAGQQMDGAGTAGLYNGVQTFAPPRTNAPPPDRFKLCVY